ncbi:MAG: hypothetical protein V3W19_11985 [Desulfatiglandales bacterium]
MRKDRIMGREVRRVPEDWNHPRDERTHNYTPLFDGYKQELAEFQSRIDSHGLSDAIDYFGGGPQSEDYMPDWHESERTHYMMYEDTSEGTPISPAMESPETLARWLADNGASSFGSGTATYDQWLSTCRGAWAPSMVMEGGALKSGVEFAADHDKQQLQSDGD